MELDNPNRCKFQNAHYCIVSLILLLNQKNLISCHALLLKYKTHSLVSPYCWSDMTFIVLIKQQIVQWHMMLPLEWINMTKMWHICMSLHSHTPYNHRLRPLWFDKQTLLNTDLNNAIDNGNRLFGGLEIWSGIESLFSKNVFTRVVHRMHVMMMIWFEFCRTSKWCDLLFVYFIYSRMVFP